MEFHFPQQTHLAQGICQKIGPTARDLGTRVLLLTDPAFVGSQELGIVTASLDRAGVSHLVLARNPRHSPAEAHREAVTVARASRMDVLAAFGGSDQLSLGRLVSDELSAAAPIPYLEIPTTVCYPLLLRAEAFMTSGHPSDLRFIPFSASAGHHIFLDPYLTIGQTPKASVASLLEALFYAVEVCLHEATDLVSQSLLIGAVSVLWTNLKKIHDDPAKVEYRAQASEAGFAIATACALGPRGTGVSFGFLLAGLAGLSTSAFGSLLLAPILEFHAAKAGSRLGPLAKAFGFDLVEGEEGRLGPKIAQEVRKFMNQHKLPLRLAEYKLVDTQINQAVDVTRGLGLVRGGVLDPDSLPDFLRSIL